METKSGRTNTVIEQLFRSPQSFDYCQAIRLLEQKNWHGTKMTTCPVGYAHMPKNELLRFKNSLSFSFSAYEITHLSKNIDSSNAPVTMTVAMPSLLGTQGVMPDHYTEMAIAQKQEKQSALTDFLDIFNHRTQSFFYRAWEKYRFYLHYEREQKRPEFQDTFTHLLHCLIGVKNTKKSNTQAFENSSLLYYAGLLTQRPRSAILLAALLSHYFQLKFKVKQFQGTWLTLDLTERTQFGMKDKPKGSFNQLGKDCIIGKRVWNVQSKFRVCIGPLNYSDGLQFLPNGKSHQALTDLINYYVGAQLQFDIQIIIKSSEVPNSRLCNKNAYHLGWNTWLKHRPLKQDNDAIIIRTKL